MGLTSGEVIIHGGAVRAEPATVLNSGIKFQYLYCMGKLRGAKRGIINFAPFPGQWYLKRKI